jgi:hypothetical protein
MDSNSVELSTELASPGNVGEVDAKAEGPAPSGGTGATWKSSLPDDAPATPGSPVLRRRPRGKIARLARALREKINELLDDGLSYPEVIGRMGAEVEGLNEMDLSRWYKSGHQEWIKNQVWLENTRTRLDFATDVIAEHKGSEVHQANLHVAATQLIEDLMAKGEKVLAEKPEEYVTLINSVARLSREALNYQKYREACLLARTELAKLKDPTRKISEEETQAIVEHVDRILGFK